MFIVTVIWHVCLSGPWSLHASSNTACCVQSVLSKKLHSYIALDSRCVAWGKQHRFCIYRIIKACHSKWCASLPALFLKAEIGLGHYCCLFCMGLVSSCIYLMAFNMRSTAAFISLLSSLNIMSSELFSTYSILCIYSTCTI